MEFIILKSKSNKKRAKLSRTQSLPIKLVGSFTNSAESLHDIFSYIHDEAETSFIKIDKELHKLNYYYYKHYDFRIQHFLEEISLLVDEIDQMKDRIIGLPDNADILELSKNKCIQVTGETHDKLTRFCKTFWNFEKKRGQDYKTLLTLHANETTDLSTAANNRRGLLFKKRLEELNNCLQHNADVVNKIRNDISTIMFVHVHSLYEFILSKEANHSEIDTKKMKGCFDGVIGFFQNRLRRNQ